jgi:ketosteroid isomerase-like protein
MTVQTTAFDIDAYASALECWDVDALADMYTEDTEFVKIDSEHPASDPRVVHGRETLRGMFTHCATIGVQSTLHHTLSGPDRAAATGTCVFPDGRKVTFNHVNELRDGRIARQTEITISETR